MWRARTSLYAGPCLWALKASGPVLRVGGRGGGGGEVQGITGPVGREEESSEKKEKKKKGNNTGRGENMGEGDVEALDR